jgi:hypothetical protein
VEAAPVEDRSKCAMHDQYERRIDAWFQITNSRFDKLEFRVEKLDAKLDSVSISLGDRIDVLATRLNMYSGGLAVLVLIVQTVFMYLMSRK